MYSVLAVLCIVHGVPAMCAECLVSLGCAAGSLEFQTAARIKVLTQDAMSLKLSRQGRACTSPGYRWRDMLEGGRHWVMYQFGRGRRPEDDLAADPQYRQTWDLIGRT